MTGDAGRRGRVLEHPSSAQIVGSAALPVLDEADAPNDLTMDERHVWLELAPLAMRAGTLLAASAVAFKLLCRNIVLERAYATSVTDRGTANHRGMIQRVEGALDAFQLRPAGRPMPDARPDEKPVSKLSRFLSKAHA